MSTLPFSRLLQCACLAASVLGVLSQQATGTTTISTRVNPNNGETYALIAVDSGWGWIDGLSWADAEAYAQSAYGGHLATVDSASENIWLTDTFWPYRSALWIGLNDVASPGNFVWASGAPVTYTNWMPLWEPNIGSNHYVQLTYSGQWRTQWEGDTYAYGVVELPTAAAQQCSWLASNGGNYADISNWSGPEALNINNGAYFRRAGTYTVTFGGTIQAKLAVVEKGTVSFELAQGCYILSDLYVANLGGQSASLTPRNGLLQTINLVLGQEQGSTGTVTLDNSVEWSNTGDAIIGNAGLGTLRLTGGHQLTMPSGSRIWLGAGMSGWGQMTLSGPGTSLNAGVVDVGEQGGGSLALQEQTSATITTLQVGVQETGHGAVTVSGGLLNVTNTLTLGHWGHTSGSLTVSNVGMLTAITVMVGESADASGALTVTGPGSSLQCIGGITVGNDGAGSLTVANGAWVQPNTLTAGQWSSGRGTVTVTGAGSMLQTFATMEIGNEGHGVLNITAGGAVRVSYAELNVGRYGTGDGQVLISDAGSSLSVSNTANVARAGEGSISVSNGGYATFGEINVGVPFMVSLAAAREGTSAPAATLNVSGAGSIITVMPGEATGQATFGPNAVLNVQSGGAFRAMDMINDGTIQVSQGSLVAASVENRGLINLGTGANAVVNDVANYGQIALGDASAALNGDGQLENDGLISGSGRIGLRVANKEMGEIRASTGQSLVVSGWMEPNLGMISLLGGSIQFTQSMTNEQTGIIRGNGTLMMPELTNAGQIQLSPGNTVIYGDILAQEGSRIAVASGATATFYGTLALNDTPLQVAQNGIAVFYGDVTGNGAISGEGIFDWESGHSPLAADLVVSGTVQVQPAAKLEAPALRARSLVLSGKVTIYAGGSADKTSVIESLTYRGGTLDLKDNDAIFRNTSAAAIKDLVRSGYHNGAWDGAGIVTSMAAAGEALAVVPGTSYLQLRQTALFNGLTVDGSDVLLKYTYQGDADLDGQITLSDYAQIDAAFLFHMASPYWSNGDFNYDGTVDYRDYAMIDFAFGRQSGALAADMIGQHTAAFGAPYVELLTAMAAPEPGTLGLLLAAATGLLGVRRRR